MKVLSALLLSVIVMSGCVVAGPEYGYVATPTAEVVFESDVVVGDYYVGFFRPGFGYWTGYGWDVDFYVVGHPGYGHFYRGAPRGYYHNYVGGPHFRGHSGGHVVGHHR